jgi:Kdo2-lipid IVA lauroyltransferase/acyltransferase
MRNPLRRLYKGSPRVRRIARGAKNGAVVGAARMALWLIGKLSLDRALRLAERIGALLYRVLRTPRRLVDAHLQIAFGETLAPAARVHLARASFINIARCFVELAEIDAVRARRDTYFEVEGREHLDAVLARGTGAIVITGHIGNWELLAAYFAWLGYPVAAVARRIYAERLNRLLVDFRSRQGVETILRESPSSSRQILRALKNNALLAMLIDQDTHVPSVSVPFFGRLARTPAAAASLAVRRELPVFAAFIQRRGEGGHRITLSPPFAVESTGDRQGDIRALTKQFNAALEAQIRRNPAEWVWWHRRWRRAPQPHLDIDGGFQYTRPDVAVRGRG